MHSLMSSACAIESRIAGSCSKFSRLWLSRTTSRQKEWNLPDIFCFVSASRHCYMCRQGLKKSWVAEDVLTLNACLAIIGHNFPTRSCISLQALLVNVSARILKGSTPPDIKWAIRVVITFVFPLPAPAIIIIGPSLCSTALRCGSFNSSKYLGIAQMYE